MERAATILYANCPTKIYKPILPRARVILYIAILQCLLLAMAPSTYRYLSVDNHPDVARGRSYPDFRNNCIMC